MASLPAPAEKLPSLVRPLFVCSQRCVIRVEIDLAADPERCKIRPMGWALTDGVSAMDARQEARDRFGPLDGVAGQDRYGRGVHFPGDGGLLVMETISPTKSGNGHQDFVVFYVVTSASIGAFAILYFAGRFVAALVIAANAVRRRDRTNARGAADRHADSPAAPAQIVLQPLG